MIEGTRAAAIRKEALGLCFFLLAFGGLSRKLPLESFRLIPRQRWGGAMGGCGGGRGWSKNPDIFAASPGEFGAQGGCPKRFFGAFFGSSAWTRFYASPRRSGTGLMLLMLAGRRALAGRCRPKSARPRHPAESWQ